MKRRIFIAFCGLLSFAMQAQERLGITNSNYASTSSIFLNPSSSVDSRTYWQLNLVGLNAYFMNNLGYIPKFSIYSTIKNGGIEKFKTSSLEGKKFLAFVAAVEGPAFVISKRNYGAGFFVRARSVGELKRIPFDLANFVLNPDTAKVINFPVDVNLRNLRFSNMSWVEYGLNFGMMVKRDRTNLWTMGGSLRYLTGLNIAYGNLQQLKGSIDATGVELEKLKGKLRYNQFGWKTGKGIGLDFGITYKKMLEVIDRYYANSELSNCKYVDYKYRVGISLRDLGFIRFKKNTTTSEINESGRFDVDTNNRKISFNQDLIDNFNAPLKHDPILACLPTALSVQIDWNFGNHLYLNATAVKNLVPNSFTGVQGSNLISVCPRYEFKQFELAMPLTLQKFIYPQLGFAFRVRTFVLGFDNVFPLIIKKNTYGVNVYLNIGISRFKNPACNKRIRRLDDCAPKEYSKKKKSHKRKLAPPNRKDFGKPKKIKR